MKDVLFLALLCTTPLTGSPTAQEVRLQGDALLNGVSMESAMQIASAAGAEISLDLTCANPEVTALFRERIWALLEKYTDILLINAEEAYALTHLPAGQAARFLNNFCPIVMIKEDETGCWVYDQDTRIPLTKWEESRQIAQSNQN